MGKLWLKIWVWIKISVFSLVALYVLAFVLENVNREASFWYAYDREVKTKSLTLAFFAFLAGVVSTILIRTTLVTLRQFREMKERNRQERMAREFEEMRAKAERLAPRTNAPAPVTPPAANPIATPAPEEGNETGLS